MLGHSWPPNFGEISRIRDRLSDDGLIEHVLAAPESSRKLYRITGHGQRSLDTFILEPPTDVPRPLRQALAVKLLFAGTDRVPQLLGLIDHQRRAYLRQRHLL